MLNELGLYALIVAFIAALVQGILPLLGAARGNLLLMRFAEPATVAQAAAVVFAFIALLIAYIHSDFSLLVVASHSHSAKPLLYKITGLWGNHEGSMLLWVTVMALFGAAVAAFSKTLPVTLKARVLAVQGLVGAGFYAFILFTSNPFLRIFPPPIEGNGLNPILQDPGLAFHPPMLYVGYVGFSVTFSFAVAALIEGKIDPAWARWVRPWSLIAWVCLTFGIALGSWWAYYDLGWGGWWAWDPVENASFMPWLLGTALLHSAIVVEKRDAFKGWTVLLAILTFALSMIGTFLVRSGVLISVHTFASDPERGKFILALLVVIIGGALALFAARGRILSASGSFPFVSREGALLINNLFLASAAATVFLGTLTPLLFDAMNGPKVSVGAPYYQLVFIPLMTPFVIAMAVGPLLAWRKATLKPIWRRLRWGLVAACGAGIGAWYLAAPTLWMGITGAVLGLWLIFGLVTAVRQQGSLRMPTVRLPMLIAHFGLAVAIIGMTGSLWKIEVIKAMHPGDTIAAGPYMVRFDGITQITGPNYTADRATLLISRAGREVAKLTPEKRRFTAPPMVVTNTGIHTTGFSDLYAALGDIEPDSGIALRLYYTPLVPFIWFGAALMGIGGLLALNARLVRTRREILHPAHPALELAP